MFRRAMEDVYVKGIIRDILLPRCIYMTYRITYVVNFSLLNFAFFLAHEGYTIPKGSKMMISPTTTHLNPTLYKEPNEFNPWRWQVSELQRTFSAYITKQR
jgi:hypothetical protein